MSEFPCPIARAPEHAIAIVSKEQKISYGELDRRIAKLCTSLRQKGIAHNHKVAFIPHIQWETIAIFFALFRLGAIACPLSARLPTAQISEALSQLRADHFLEIDSLSFQTQASSSALIKEEQLATLLFTSGSTSHPKIVCLSYGNHLYNALGMNDALKLSSEKSWLLTLPLYHVGGIAILFRCFLAGATVALPPISYEEVSFLSFVPTQLYRLKCVPKATILVGGAPLPDALRKKGFTLVPTYGLSEMSSTVTLETTPPLAYREFRLAKDREILVRGKTLFQGYALHDGSTVKPVIKVDAEGWFATGDLGEIATGALRVTGRKDNLFISGGENIQPEEIEAALLALPHIAHAIVVPIPDEEFGARPVAFIEDLSNEYTLLTLHRALENSLPHFKFPTQLFPLPNEQQGLKPSRKRLKELLQNRCEH
jgi:o-succinylbenzoate---CoA ligase